MGHNSLLFPYIGLKCALSLLYETQMLKKLLEDAINEPGFLTVDLGNPGIEVKPGRFSPIYINMKTTWKNHHLLSRMSHELQRLCLDCDCVVGVETGGSPYAVSIAQNLGISLLLARKEPKDKIGILAGGLNGDSHKFAIVDDVLASGRSMEPAFQSIKDLGKKVVCVAILSYGMDDLIAKKYDIEVRTLYKIEDLLDSLKEEEKNRLTEYVKDYQEKLRSVINI